MDILLRKSKKSKRRLLREEKRESSKEIEKEEVSLEELFQKLDFIVEKIENGKPALDESFHLYQEGMELLKHGLAIFH